MKEEKSRIGIMGGTFNPVHYGHLLIAENAAEQFALDEVIFMPTGHSPHKGAHSMADSFKRCDMIELAIGNNPHFSLSLLEVNSVDINFTYKTLETLRIEYKDAELFFIMGGDSLFDFDSWKYPERILKSASVLAAIRDNWEGNRFERQISYLNHKYGKRIFRLNTPNLSISSQHIRTLISNNQTIRYMLPDEVLHYIKEHELYLERR